MRYVRAIVLTLLCKFLLVGPVSHAEIGWFGELPPNVAEQPVETAASALSDECDTTAEMELYEAGDLTTRFESEWFGHGIKITVFCDEFDVDAAFDWIRRTERRFLDLFGFAVSPIDGEGYDLHVVIGKGRALCEDLKLGGCGDLGSGRAWHLCHRWKEVEKRSGECGYWSYGTYYDSADYGVTFMPVHPDEAGWATNIVHEWTHLLDFLYVYRDYHYRYWSVRLTEWWKEGMPEYVQMSLREEMGLDHSPHNRCTDWENRRCIGNKRSLVSTAMGQSGMDVYASGRALVRYLALHDPFALEDAARLLHRGVGRTREGLARWWRWTDVMLSRHEEAYAEWNTRNGFPHDGFGGDDEIEIDGETMLDQFLVHPSVRRETLIGWIDFVCDEDAWPDEATCRANNSSHGYTLNGIAATSVTDCYVAESLKYDIRIQPERRYGWLPGASNRWQERKYAEECPETENRAFWLSD